MDGNIAAVMLRNPELAQLMEIKYTPKIQIFYLRHTLSKYDMFWPVFATPLPPRLFHTTKY